jgi:hypothetical protein
MLSGLNFSKMMDPTGLFDFVLFFRYQIVSYCAIAFIHSPRSIQPPQHLPPVPLLYY